MDAEQGERILHRPAWLAATRRASTIQPLPHEWLFGSRQVRVPRHLQTHDGSAFPARSFGNLSACRTVGCAWVACLDDALCATLLQCCRRFCRSRGQCLFWGFGSEQ